MTAFSATFLISDFLYEATRYSQLYCELFKEILKVPYAKYAFFTSRLSLHCAANT